MTDHPTLKPTTVTATGPRRLTRAEQLTLTTWRWAFVALCRHVEPQDLLPQVALQVVLARLRDCADPLQLFIRHYSPQAEFALAASLIPDTRREGLEHDLVDSAFLLRWNELTADGKGPLELPPLTPRRPVAVTTEHPWVIADDIPQPTEDR